jgi:hypothetical protein
MLAYADVRRIHRELCGQHGVGSQQGEKAGEDGKKKKRRGGGGGVSRSECPPEGDVTLVEGGGGGGVAAEGKEAFRLEEESFDRIVLDPPCTALGLRPRLSIDVPATEMLRTAGIYRLLAYADVC